MEVKILIAGFGGQGLMRLGKILAKAAVWEGKHTIFFPSYGAEMRGGTAHCFVKISDLPLASPFINHPDIAIIFNQLSFDKFKSCLTKRSLLILNSDLIEQQSLPENIPTISLPLNRMALECGNLKVANTIALGLLNSLRPQLLKRQTLIEVLEETFRNKDSLRANLQGFRRGETALERASSKDQDSIKKP